MANGNPALSDALGTTPALLGGLGKKRTTQERAQFAGENYGQALEGQTAAELESRTKKGEAKVAGLEAEVEAERELGRTMQRQGEELEAGLKSYEKFEAPEYTASDYAADAAKRLLVGLLIGGTTRLSGEGQLRAIKAMQDAEDQGLEEQFVQARMAFDENEKARVEHNKRLQDRFARLKELATQDRASAMVEAKLLAAQMENGAIAADLRAGNYLKAIKQFEDAMKLQQQYQLEQMKAQTRAAAKGPTRQGQLALNFASRVYGNIKNAFEDAASIQTLPAVSESPVLAGMINRDPETAIGSLSALVGRTITNQDKRSFDQVTNSLSAALSMLESQGLASGGSQARIKAFDALKPKAGDKAINMALYIARVKQEIQNGIDVHEKMPGATQGQKDAAQKMLQELDTIIPFNVRDVMSALRNGRVTLGEKMNELVEAPGIVQTIIEENQEQMVYRPQTQEDFDNIPSNRIYIDPDDGKRYRKP